MSMKYLKVASAQWAGYTGPLGQVMFKDGQSVDMLPRHIRDRLAAGMEFLEVDEDGNEQPAGAAHRLVAESAARAPVAEPLARQTEEEKAAEEVAIALRSAAETNAVVVLHSAEELHAIADKGGIASVREVAKKWNVKHRSLIVLTQMILDAQAAWVADRDLRLAKKVAAEVAARGGEPEIQPAGEPEAPAESDVEPKEGEPEGETEVVEDDVEGETQMDLLKAAAVTGDLAAALNAGEEAPEGEAE